MGDWLVSLLNTNIHAYEASPVLTLAEIEVIQALTKTIGYNTGSGGVFCPGGSYSNMYAMYLAKKNLTDRNNEIGIHDLVVLTSEHSHYSIDKASALMGIDSSNIVKVPCDYNGRMLPSILRKKVEKVVKSGKKPFFLNATLGTTVLGAFDPLEELSWISSEYDIWLHADAAWGEQFFFQNNIEMIYVWELKKQIQSPGIFIKQ